MYTCIHVYVYVQLAFDDASPAAAAAAAAGARRAAPGLSYMLLLGL